MTSQGLQSSNSPSGLAGTSANPASRVRVRFAPSPTGYLHVGGARTALFNWLFARKLGGDFLLRIEDTDQSRYSATAETELLADLKWLGLEWDEGPGIGGPCGPYRQSDRLPLYQEKARELVAAGLAYPCFCTSERLEQLREQQTTAGAATGYDGHCRHLDPAEAARRVAAGEPHIIRLKVPAEGETSFHDLLRGNISTPNGTLDDMVLLKGDGFPTYHLANVIDDHAMAISHVLRGDEWIPSTSRHILLYRAFGWQPPIYVHLPVILAAGGGKLSKRKGAASVGDYREKGYLPIALFNFLALLGWNPGDGREKMTLAEMVEAFSLERISSKSAAFDEPKLEWLNSEYIQKDDPAPLLPLFRELFAKAGIDLTAQSDERLLRIIASVRERVRLLGDFLPQARWYFAAPTEYDPAASAKVWKAETSERLEGACALLRQLSQAAAGEAGASSHALDPAALETALHDLGEAKGWKLGSLMQPIRLALCGALIGPPVPAIIAELGAAEAIARLEATLPRIAASLGAQAG